MLNLETDFKLKSFNIFGLFGKSNVKIEFDENIKVFVGENGIGKTTILNVLFYTISLNFEKLREIQFEKIEVQFQSEESIYLKKSWIEKQQQVNLNQKTLRILREYMNSAEYMRLKDFISNEEDFTTYELVNYLQRRHTVPEHVISYIIEDLEEFSFFNENRNRFTFDNSKREKNSKKNVEKFVNKIREVVKEEILYFPTYRRIEEDLMKLGSNVLKKQKQIRVSSEIIQFGMNDVQEIFNNIEEEIKDSTLIGYSRVTGEMITHLVHHEKVTNAMMNKIKDTQTLNIVLDRVGSNLPSTDREKIKELINSKELFNDNSHIHEQLIFFLYNLIDIYELNSTKEESIKTFSSVCNNYLVNKEVVYNQNTVKISIIDKSTKKPIKISNLSSGEKQIVSLFTKVYLTSKEKFIVLFDEPELSLSIEWQENLLPDIMRSGKCTFLFTVTHSPFIYQNDLKKYAQNMELFIEEVGSNE